MANPPSPIEPYTRIARASLSVLGLAMFFLAACSEEPTVVPQASASPLVAFTTRTPFDETPTPHRSDVPTTTSTPAYALSATLNPTVDATLQTWHETAIALATTQRAESNLARDDKATEIARFPATCDDMNIYSSSISPDGKWLAASCGYKRDQTLLVQNKEGVTWILEFKNFLSPDSPEGMTGALLPEFWSPDGEYLFFATTLGYDGGGNDCFSGYGVYGLFRLSLTTGIWTTFIPPTDSFPGYEIKFSSTGRRFAADLDGILIADLQTGAVTQLDIPGARVMDLSWSPNGVQLAYSVASCGEEFAETSFVYVWDATTQQAQILTATQGRIILRPESWDDSSTLRIREEKLVGLDAFYAVYVYDTSSKRLVSAGTATPSP